MAVTPLNSLHAFVAVARKLSYAAAARELGVSMLVLSQSVRQLEQRVGLPLLQRTSRSVALTDAGQRRIAIEALDVELGQCAYRSANRQRVALGEGDSAGPSAERTLMGSHDVG